MKILILTQWFHPEPFFKGLPFATALQARGHQVEVLTGFPNYPGGRLYPGYTVRWHQVEHLNGIRVHRVPLYPSHDAGALRRAWNYVSFALSAASIGMAVVSRPDLIYVYHPPATVGFPAWVLSRWLGCPFVYDVQDLWPDTLRATGMVSSGTLLKMVGAWCRFVYAAAARVVVLSPGFKQAIAARGVPENRIDVIMNWAEEFAALETLPERDGPTFDVLYAGNLGKVQALDTVLSAAAVVQAEAPQVRFVFLGDGIEKPRLELAARAAQLTNVTFLDRQTPSEAAGTMSRAGALLVHLRRDELFEITIPSKTQAYLRAGRPILMGVRGNAADLVRRAEAGVCFEPEDPRALADAVMAMARLPAAERQAMGRRGHAFYQEVLSQQVAVGAFDELFRSVVRRRQSAVA